jgi:hypothetical protein
MPKRFTVPPIPGVDQAVQGLLAAPELVSKILADAQGGIRKTLFHDNVRDFLGYNEVNSDIRDTLRDPVRRKRFAVLNNGVTIVARDLSVIGDDLVLRDFQIVNGGQTCHVLFDQRAMLTGDVQVSVRIVHCQDEDVIGGIVAATNRQTAITEDDLAAREEFHRRLEEFFPAARDKAQRLYYERRSKQYSERSDVEKTRVISRVQLTRAYAAMFLRDPAGGYSDLVADRRHELFQDGHHLVAYYAAAVAYYRLEWLIRNRRMDRAHRPALYHLLAAISFRLLRSTAVHSLSPKAAAAECDRVLAVMWDADRAEKLVSQLWPAFDRIIKKELAAGVPLGEMVRNQRFADQVRVALQP